MSTKHTKGPWAYTICNIGHDHYIPSTVHSEKGAIAEVHGFGDCQQDAMDQADANARLIAAAPELLNAVRFVLEYHADKQNEQTLDVLRAALAKAECKLEEK